MAGRKSAKAPRCAYIEGDQRCRRNGDGNPPLCEAHRIVIESEATRPQRPGEKIVGLLGRVFRGQKISDDSLYSGLEDFVDLFARTPGPQGRSVFDEARERAADYVRSKQQGESPPRTRKPSGPDPRVVIGFAAGQKLTVDAVKKRHRELARRHHPDRGGSVATMAAINHAVDQLLKELSAS